MKELNDEIMLTINLMQADIDDGAHSELQFHLYSLLEIKRERLAAKTEPRAKQLTTEVLRVRVFMGLEDRRQIHRIGNEFYWSGE